MIRDGKAAGWLQLQPEALLAWANLNDVALSRVTPGVIPGKGGALLATQDLPANHERPQVLMTVPRALILSLETVQEHTKVDADFREVLQALGDFGKTSRGAILTFLLMQASLSCPDLTEHAGVHSLFTEYVKSLPCELLPTFWTPEELQLLLGTSLHPAITSKMRSLHREYDTLREATVNTRWFSIVRDHLEFDDWLQVDAMYRSRALDFPGIGHCMVPCIDLANHTAGEATIAIYEKDPDGNAVLQLRDGKSVAKGEEISITYGDEKGACEMLFSYGFLEHDRQSAETLFLSLTIPENDPYRTVKMEFADCAPGFKLIDAGDGDIDWTGEFIWMLCVTAEDGLHFDLARTVDGGEEVHAFFGEHELTGGAPELYTLLGRSDMWNLYRLRAIAILQKRVFEQLQVLFHSQADVDAMPHGDGTGIRDRCYEHATELRRLEFELLERAYGAFEEQWTVELAESKVVRRYLAKINADETEPADGLHAVEGEDFS